MYFSYVNIFLLFCSIENISSENHAQIDLNNSWGTDAEFERYHRNIRY